MELSSLEYPSKYSLPLHPPQDGTGAYTGEGKSKEKEDEDEEKTEEEVEEDIENEAEEKLKKQTLEYRGGHHREGPVRVGPIGQQEVQGPGN